MWYKIKPGIGTIGTKSHQKTHDSPNNRYKCLTVSQAHARVHVYTYHGGSIQHHHYNLPPNVPYNCPFNSKPPQIHVNIIIYILRSTNFGLHQLWTYTVFTQNRILDLERVLLNVHDKRAFHNFILYKTKSASDHCQMLTTTVVQSNVNDNIFGLVLRTCTSVRCRTRPIYLMLIHILYNNHGSR